LGEFEQTIEATRAGRREHPSLRSGHVVLGPFKPKAGDQPKAA